MYLMLKLEFNDPHQWTFWTFQRLYKLYIQTFRNSSPISNSNNPSVEDWSFMLLVFLKGIMFYLLWIMGKKLERNYYFCTTPTFWEKVNIQVVFLTNHTHLTWWFKSKALTPPCSHWLYCSSCAAVEIEQVSSLFQEKQAELQSAVLRVEQLSLQLEDLRRGKLNGIQTVLGGQVTGVAALELRKLYQELQVTAKSSEGFY